MCSSGNESYEKTASGGVGPWLGEAGSMSAAIEWVHCDRRGLAAIAQRVQAATAQPCKQQATLPNGTRLCTVRDSDAKTVDCGRVQRISSGAVRPA